MLEAKLKPEYRWPSANILGGVIFTKNDWVPVPPGMEKEALLPEYGLEVRVRPEISAKSASGVSKRVGRNKPDKVTEKDTEVVLKAPIEPVALPKAPAPRVFKAGKAGGKP